MGNKRLYPNHILQTRIYLMKLIIYGTGIFSEVLLDEIYENSKEVVAFTLDDELINSDTHMGIPLIPFSNIESKFNPSEYDLLIGITYQNKNETRKEYFLKGLEKGYSMNGFISNKSNISKNVSIGKNNIILSGNLIQTSVEIGDNNIFWNTNHIGHHTKIGNNCFISSHVVISGNCILGDNIFLGVNSTIIDNLEIEDFTLAGAGSVIKNSSKKNEIIK